MTVLFTGLGVGALAARPAAATFGAPFDLAAAGQDAGGGDVAVDPDGDAVFAWTRFDGANYRVQARTRSAAGVLSPVQTLSSSGQDALVPQVAVDPDGDAVFSWARFDGAHYRVQARARSAAGVLSAVQTLSEPGQDVFFSPVAVDADGDAVFTWERFDGTNFRIQARARSAAGVLSPVQTPSAAGQDASVPQVGVDADGDAVLAWLRSDGAKKRAQAVARNASGVLGPVQTLSSSGQDAVSIQLAVETDGDAIFTWGRSDGTNPRIQARARSAAGVLSPVQTLSDPGQEARDSVVGVDADGDAVFAWSRSDGLHSRIQARARSAAGALSPVQTLSTSLDDAVFPQIGVDAGGDAVVTYRIFDPALKVVEARERSAAGALLARQILSDPEDNARGAVVAMNADGDAACVWQYFDGAHDRVKGAVGP